MMIHVNIQETYVGQCRLIDLKMSIMFIINVQINTQKIVKLNSRYKNISQLDDRGVNAPYKECVEGMEKEIYDCCVSGCDEKTDDTFDCDRYCTFCRIIWLQIKFQKNMVK